MKTKLCIFLFLFAYACNTQQNNSIQQFCAEYKINPNFGHTALVFIPLDGCGVCIDTSIVLAKQNFVLPNTYYIVSAIGRKPISLHFTENEMTAPSFVADTKCFAQQLQLVGSSPEIYLFENGEVIKQLKISPSKAYAAFEELKKSCIKSK